MVRSPVAGTVIRWPSAGTDPTWMGWVRTNVALGYRLVARARWTALSRRESLVVMSVRSAAIWAAVTVEPETVMVPSTDGVRPTAVALPTETSTSSIRKPVNDPLPWALVMLRSTFHVPSVAPAVLAVAAGAAGAGVAGVDSMPARAWSRLDRRRVVVTEDKPPQPGGGEQDGDDHRQRHPAPAPAA